MANDTILHMVGNLTDDPELRFTPSGAAVANFTIAQTPSTFDKQRQEWVDGDPVFMSCSAWNQQAEHVAESLRKGNRVAVSGRLKTEKWEDKTTGSPRSKLVLVCDEVSASLKYATAQVTRMTRQGAQGGSAPAGASRGPAVGQDPWATGPARNDEPPF